AAPTVPVPTPSSGPAHAAPAAPAAHVARQVFPEVTSLMTRGDGTHRITLTLKPEALGEVRVVMTVRDGAVHVRLAAGHEAQQSLLQGSHELGRLLEAAGATETRVVVRDLGSANATAAAGPDLSQGLGDPRPQDQHAGTRAQHPATDGTNDTRATRGTTGANPPRSVEPVTHSRTAGVDVTM
ncbi:MAG TPA: flagellar hook-length control protein FliK, partial [Marmoricola sp.]